MRIYEELTESPETLGAFLKSLPVLDAPWDTAFQKTFCRDFTRKSIPFMAVSESEKSV